MKASEIEAGKTHFKDTKTGRRRREVLSINRIMNCRAVMTDYVNFRDWGRGGNPNSWSGEWQMTLRAFARWAEGKEK